MSWLMSWVWGDEIPEADSSTRRDGSPRIEDSSSNRFREDGEHDEEHRENAVFNNNSNNNVSNTPRREEEVVTEEALNEILERCRHYNPYMRRHTGDSSSSYSSSSDSGCDEGYGEGEDSYHLSSAGGDGGEGLSLSLGPLISGATSGAGGAGDGSYNATGGGDSVGAWIGSLLRRLTTSDGARVGDEMRRAREQQVARQRAELGVKLAEVDIAVARHRRTLRQCALSLQQVRRKEAKLLEDMAGVMMGCLDVDANCGVGVSGSDAKGNTAECARTSDGDDAGLEASLDVATDKEGEHSTPHITEAEAAMRKQHEQVAELEALFADLLRSINEKREQVEERLCTIQYELSALRDRKRALRHSLLRSPTATATATAAARGTADPSARMAANTAAEGAAVHATNMDDGSMDSCRRQGVANRSNGPSTNHNQEQPSQEETTSSQLPRTHTSSDDDLVDENGLNEEDLDGIYISERVRRRWQQRLQGETPQVVFPDPVPIHFDVEYQ